MYRPDEVLVDRIACLLEQSSVTDDARAVVDFVLSDDGLQLICECMEPSELLRIVKISQG